MDMGVWIWVYGYGCMDMGVWTCANEKKLTVMGVWLSAGGGGFAMTALWWAYGLWRLVSQMVSPPRLRRCTTRMSPTVLPSVTVLHLNLNACP